MKNWYVYRITFSDGSFYFGYRGTAKRPECDFMVKYFTSSKIVKSRLANNEMMCGELIETFDCKETAYAFEQQLIKENFHDQRILNQRYYENGFGVISEASRAKISKSSKASWSTNRDAIISSQRNSWSDERKQEQSSRLTGVKRPDHSVVMKGKKLTEEHKEKLRRVVHTKEWNEKMAAALRGKPKSEEHRMKLKRPKPLTVCRLEDKRPMALANFMKWFNRRS